MAKHKTPKTARLTRALACLVLAAALAGAAMTADLLWLYPDRPGAPFTDPVTVQVPQGTGPVGLARVLHDAGVLRSPRKFSWWVRLSGQLSRVRSGDVEVRGGMTPRELLAATRDAGRQLGQRVTIPEGFTVRRMAKVVEAAGVASELDMIALASDPGLLAELGIEAPTLEGFLFPDTYYFRKAQGARSVLATLARTLPRKLYEAGMDPQSVDLPVLTLASIVQAEAKIEQEMPTIAGVYRNRLTSPAFPSRRLQADPTVAYGCEPLLGRSPPSCRPWRGILTRRQLEDTENAYNTYAHAGLPPTPICSPGLLAIRAALQPADVSYFFFVAEGDTGRHVFSETLAEHNEAVRRYRASR